VSSEPFLSPPTFFWSLSLLSIPYVRPEVSFCDGGSDTLFFQPSNTRMGSGGRVSSPTRFPSPDLAPRPESESASSLMLYADLSLHEKQPHPPPPPFHPHRKSIRFPPPLLGFATLHRAIYFSPLDVFPPLFSPKLVFAARFFRLHLAPLLRFPRGSPPFRSFASLVGSNTLDTCYPFRFSFPPWNSPLSFWSPLALGRISLCCSNSLFSPPTGAFWPIFQFSPIIPPSSTPPLSPPPPLINVWTSLFLV